MAPDWDKLTTDWKDDKVGLIAKVDCSDDNNKSLCKKNKVYDFPTIKYGDPNSLEFYDGGRSYENLSQFANAVVSKPVCNSIHKCDDEEMKSQMYEWILSDNSDATLREERQMLKMMSKEFDVESKKLQDEYQRLSDEKDAKVQAVTGLIMAKNIKKYREKKENNKNADDSTTTTTESKDEL
eukprot:CAMPEP_0194187102 /NCGR_PEP_ID=MMETSP0154-20130528/49520_1 /TAXON_ID=1049557 /ORGANISM="Thalassiothrix antarctica, Strain L6-D1" /LENGTH=181 /DNA_ID=CAMNT_0038906597 /DNA_START=211 /DNA_END=756 /DNA_ORIENTATION=+